MAAPLFGLMAAATLAACGVPPSGVIEAGEPASGMVSPGPMSPSPVTTSLFFLHDGDLTAYPRTTNTGSIAVAVRLLFEGPTAHESATATTELPRLSQASLVTTGDDGILSVQLPDETSPLSHRAMLQLVCTVAQVTPSLPMSQADAEAAGGAAPSFSVPSGVRVRGDGWTMTQSDDACPLTLQRGAQPETRSRATGAVPRPGG
uniref:GerMN domain-containing protein n=1 Tax=Streptomyces sp. NBC_01401 TaxID=2903854 RepID=A0AAU3GWV4_9ACTN